MYIKLRNKIMTKDIKKLFVKVKKYLKTKEKFLQN